MSWFDINRALSDIRTFLQNWSTLIGNLDQYVRPSSIYECYCFVMLAQKFRALNYRVDVNGPTSPFLFKRSIWGFADNYTRFTVSKDSESYEIRQNQCYRNRGEVFFNLDIALISGVSSLDRGILRSDNLHTFCECKHYRTFSPSVCASFLGLARVVMPYNILNVLWAVPEQVNSPPPALLVSGSPSREVENMIGMVTRRRYYVRFFDNINPFNSLDILRDWISGTS